MKISYTVRENYNAPTGTDPTPRITSIVVEGGQNLENEIIEKFFRMLVKHPKEMELRP